MANTIRFRRGSGAPFPGGFLEGEPAWDNTNKKLYIKSSDGTMAEVSGYTFSTVSVTGQSDIIADSSSDTLTLAAGNGISITTNTTTDTVTITASSSAGVDPIIASMIW